MMKLKKYIKIKFEKETKTCKGNFRFEVNNYNYVIKIYSKMNQFASIEEVPVGYVDVLLVAGLNLLLLKQKLLFSTG